MNWLNEPSEPDEYEEDDFIDRLYDDTLEKTNNPSGKPKSKEGLLKKYQAASRINCKEKDKNNP